MASNFGATKFEIDAVIDMPADGFDAELENCDCFLAADFDNDRIELEAGFLDPLDLMGPPSSVKQLEGIIDEYSVTLNAEGSLTASVRGRDLMSNLLDREVKKLFLRNEPENDPGVDFVVGEFLASEIATDIVNSLGLDLVWQARDYSLVEDFDAVGRPLDIIKDLIEPWSQVEVFKVDVFVQESTVFVRERTGTSFTANFTFTAKDARILGLTVRKRQFTKYGQVCLFGILAPVNLDVSEVGGFTVIQSGTLEEIFTKETFDRAGNVVTRVIQTTTFRMPDRIPEETLEREYSLRGALGAELVAEVRKFNEYEQSIYDFRGALNQPRLQRQITEVKGVAEGDDTKTFQLIRTEEKEFGYDVNLLQNLTSLTKRKLNLDSGNLDRTEQVVESLKDLGFLKTEKVTTFYKFEEDEPILDRVETQVNAGLRPHGIRPPRTSGLAGTPGGDQASKQPIEIKQTISTDPKARTIRFSNRNMTEQDLQFILSQFSRASGLVEYEIEMEYVAMPFLRKASILHITDLFCDDGVTPIPLDPALVIDQRLRYDESSESPELIANLRAVFWRTS